MQYISIILGEKQQRYPKIIEIEDFKVSIPLQSLTGHTTEHPAIEIPSNSGSDIPVIYFLWKCGFDGSGCHSAYDMKYNEGEFDGIS